MILNRLNITGELNFDTPKVVLDEIADTLSIRNEHNPNRLILKINKSFNRNKIKENYESDNDSLRIIARYINCNCQSWRKSQLLKAFNFLQSFEKDKHVSLDFTYGLQTPEKCYNLNCCVLYRLCKNYDIQTYYDSTMDEMAQNIKIYLLNVENSMKIGIFNYIKYEAEKSDLINILNVINSKITIEEENEVNHGESNYREENTDHSKNQIRYTFEEYEKCANDILRIDDISSKPKDNLQAIVMAAIYHKIDLSECDNPLLEYKYLLKTPYFPYDKKLKEKLRKTFIYPDSLENPYLNCVFNPKLPINMYLQRDLETLCWKEGLNVYDDSYYSSLQIIYLTETFVHGKQGNIINEQTTFLEDISNLEYDEILVYGIRNGNKFRAYTYGELCDTFSSYKRFIDPQTNEIFSDEVIEKLQILSQKEQRETESDKAYKDRVDLGEEIERVKIYISSKNEYVKKFIEMYEYLEEEKQKKVEKCLSNLLNVAMYMRNWDGEKDYPLTSEETNFPQEEQILVDHRVTQSLIVFEKSAKELGNIGDFILKLPLMQYHKESNKFITSNDPDEGLTIKDRINIVRGGEEGNTMNSCIRMSSNKFCSSAYYYMVLIGFRMPFSISEVSHIV